MYYIITAVYITSYKNMLVAYGYIQFIKCSN